MMGSRYRFLPVVALVVVVLAGVVRAANAQAGAPDTWTTVGHLPAGRMNPAAASADGRLYVFGGFGCPSSPCATFYTYTPSANTWTTRDMPEALGGVLSATTGADGRIYLYNGSTMEGPPSIHVYDPQANAWTAVPSPPGVDDSAQLVTGHDGRIYAVGGRRSGTAVGTLSVYDSATRTWSPLPPNPAPRVSPAAAVGPDGRIYVIGGYPDGTNDRADRVEAYDPRTTSWSQVASLPTPRGEFQAVTGRDGRIYALGGGSGSRCYTLPCKVVEAYDATTNTWTPVASMPHTRWLFAAATGPDGRIYVVGGNKTVMGPGPLVTAVDAYTVVPAGQPLPTPRPGPTPLERDLAPMPTGRTSLMAASGGDGRIYAIGGETLPSPRAPPQTVQTPIVLRTVESYDPKTNTWTTTPPLPGPRQLAAATMGHDGRIYVLGGIKRNDPTGNNPPAALRSVEIYDPATHRWSSGKPMPGGLDRMAAVTGKDGRIYVLGGDTYSPGITLCNPGDAAVRRASRARSAGLLARPGATPCYGLDSAESYDPRTNTWRQLPPLHTARIGLAAAAGLDGRIYAFGGSNVNGMMSPSAEVYDPRTNRWAPIAGMLHGRMTGFAAATAKDGRIYLIGGCVGPPGNGGYYCGSPSPVDVYDPSKNSWKTIGSTLNFRQGLAAAAGADGRIYAVGGAGDGNGSLLEVYPAG